jgi:signal transduction histidine kinase
VDDGAEHLVRPVAHAGFADGYLDHVTITWDMGDHGQGPTGRALRTGTTQVVQQTATAPDYAPWREGAKKRGYASSVALPLRDGAVTFGVLNLYAPEPGAFDAAELELLERVADDLSLGILCARGKRTLSSMQRSLEQLSRVGHGERLAASLAHDVNNYLTVVLACIDDLETTAPEASRPLVHQASLALERAIALNRNLLAAATPAADDAPPIGVDDFLRSLDTALRTVAGGSVTLATTLASGGSTRIEPSSLEQIVLNLVVNARDAMLPGGGAIAIETRPLDVRSPLPVRHLGMHPGPYVAIRVSDSGPGIPEALLDRVFDPFFTTKGTAGTGIGLATARAFAHQARGRLTVESTPGNGTTFELLLPRAD